MPQTVIFIESPRAGNTLSSQLEKFTGDPFSSQKFHSAHKPDSLTAAGMIEHKESGLRLFVPFVGHIEESDPYRCVKELLRIERCPKNTGGFTHGDTEGPEGRYGKEILDNLEFLGLAERTGRRVPNAYDGTWPEVRITELGKEACGAYRRWLRLKQAEVEMDLGI